MEYIFRSWLGTAVRLRRDFVVQFVLLLLRTCIGFAMHGKGDCQGFAIGDARSWYMISGDAKSWVCLHIFTVILHNCPLCVVNKGHVYPSFMIRGTITKEQRGSLKAEGSQPLGSRVPLTDEEFEASEPLDTRTTSSHSSASSDSTTPLSPNHPLTQVIDPLRDIPHSSSRPSVWKRYIGTSELILETDSERDELGEEDTEEDKSSDTDDNRERLVVDTAASVPLGLGYRAARHRALESTKEITHSTYEVGQSSRSVAEQEGAERTPPSPEWSLGSLPVLPSSPVVPSPIASPVATLAATISVDEDQFIEVGAQLELHGSILHDHT
ncbi:hypothetical protein Tco_0286891 [Tanacetum coccineum]